MAILRSEDEQNVSSVTLTPLAMENIDGQKWQRFAIVLASGNQRFELGSAKNNPFWSDASNAVDCLLCRDPKDEVSQLIALISNFLDGKKDKVLFEPAEPSFELTLERGKAEGIKLHFFVDTGNATEGIYRWDAFGIRFHVVPQQLAEFARQLQAECATPAAS